MSKYNMYEKLMSDYGVSRAIAVSHLTEENLKDLQEREVKRGFLIPYFNIRKLYYNTFKDVDASNVADKSRKEIEQLLWKTAGYREMEKDGENEVCKIDDMEYYHNVDVKLFHKVDITEDIKRLIEVKKGVKSRYNETMEDNS